MKTNLATECDLFNSYVICMAKIDIDNEFSARFRRLVEEKGWGDLTRVELGKKLGTSSTCATFYMNGNRLPSIPQARSISKLFGVCVEWLLTGHGPMRVGEDISDPLYRKIRVMCDDDRAVIESMINALNKSGKCAEDNHKNFIEPLHNRRKTDLRII